MAGAQRTMTIRFVGDVKDMRRGVKDLVSQLDDTESAGKRVATAMRQLAGDAERDFADARDAADKLARALGDETVAEIQAAGRSVDGYIADLRRMGLSYDDVRLDVEELAESIRRVETTRSSIDGARTSIEGMKAPIKDADVGLQGVRDSADQSRSVLANMVGNSVQDLGALGGVAGTAGMAIGQMAEYAADGNLKLAGFAKVIGPMALIAAGVAGVSWVLGKLREDTEKAAEAFEGMLEVNKSLREGQYEDAATNLQEAWGGTIAELESYGFTTKEVMGYLKGQNDITEELNATVMRHKQMLGDDLVMQMAYSKQVEKLAENVDLAKTAFRESGEQLDLTTQRTEAITEALIDLDTDGSPAVDDNRAAIHEWHDQMRRAYESTVDFDQAYQRLTGKLDAREAWLNLDAAVTEFAEAMYSGELSTREQEQALIDIKQDLIEYLMSLEGVPEEQQTYIMALIDQGSVGSAKAQLDALEKTRTAEFKIFIDQVTSAEIKQMENRLNRDINGNGIIGRARGGPVWPGGVFAVGDNPDGSWNRTTELFVPSTSGSILSAGESRAALAGMGGGGTTIINYVTVEAPALSSPAEVGAKVREILLADARTNGPVFATVRG